MLSVEQKPDTQHFFAELAGARRAALLLDYDGTLAPFCPQRQRATPYAGVTRLLREIMRSRRTRVVLITGRPAKELIPLMGLLPHPEIWGSQGLQRLTPRGICRMPEVDKHALQALSEAAIWLRQHGLLHLSEVKPGAVAVHWRGLPESQAVEIPGRVLQGWGPIAEQSRMAIVEFDGGLEMRLPRPNKGDAVRTILEEMDEEAPVAYLGDDQSDEDAFRAVQPRGLAVLVRPQPRPTSADLWLRPPQELLGFLAGWLKTCRQN